MFTLVVVVLEEEVGGSEGWGMSQIDGQSSFGVSEVVMHFQAGVID